MADANFTLDQAIEKAGALIETNNQEASDLPDGIPAFYHQRLEPSWQAGSKSNTEARKLVASLLKWAEEALPYDHGIHGALNDLDALFINVWTEIDEALSALSMFRRVLEKRAPDMLVPRPDDNCFIKKDGTRETGLETAMMYLHRWQDRGGAVGNVGQSERLEHPLTELAQIKQRLRFVIESFDEMYETTESVNSRISTLLCMACEEESRERELLLLECIGELNDSLWNDVWKAKCANSKFLPAVDA